MAWLGRALLVNATHGPCVRCVEGLLFSPPVVGCAGKPGDPPPCPGAARGVPGGFHPGKSTGRFRRWQLLPETQGCAAPPSVIKAPPPRTEHTDRRPSSPQSSVQVLRASLAKTLTRSPAAAAAPCPPHAGSGLARPALVPRHVLSRRPALLSAGCFRRGRSSGCSGRRAGPSRFYRLEIFSGPRRGMSARLKHQGCLFRNERARLLQVIKLLKACIRAAITCQGICMKSIAAAHLSVHFTFHRPIH